MREGKYQYERKSWVTISFLLNLKPIKMFYQDNFEGEEGEGEQGGCLGRTSSS
jgi:hypothetical protein